jgi:hypothetical protein
MRGLTICFLVSWVSIASQDQKSLEVNRPDLLPPRLARSEPCSFQAGQNKQIPRDVCRLAVSSTRGKCRKTTCTIFLPGYDRSGKKTREVSAVRIKTVKGMVPSVQGRSQLEIAP